MPARSGSKTECFYSDGAKVGKRSRLPDRGSLAGFVAPFWVGLPASKRLKPNARVACWDLPWAVGDSFVASGCSQKQMYCPGTAQKFLDSDNLNLWGEINVTGQTPGTLHTIGYAMTLPGTVNEVQADINKKLSQPPTNTVSTRVLAADATLSLKGQFTYPPPTTYTWNEIPGGYFRVAGTPYPHATSHLMGIQPRGGNELMLDGHTEWTKFSLMTCHTLPSSSIPGFWW